MKKNLRIVSAAAAALLAVAPVAAGVVPAANVATTVNAAQAKAGSLKVPAAFADTKKAAEFGTMPAKESQVETLQNYNNSEATAKKANDQLGRILAYNGLASNLVVNYVENVQTVGSKTTVTFQLATSDKDAKKALKDLGYKFETGHDEDSTYQVVKNGTENAKFSVVLDTKANTLFLTITVCIFCIIIVAIIGLVIVITLLITTVAIRSSPVLIPITITITTTISIIATTALRSTITLAGLRRT